MSDNQRGALLMMASMLVFTLNDTFVKLLGQTLPLGQILYLRGIFALIVMVVLAWRMGALKWSFSAKDWVLVIIRALAEIGAAYYFLSALFYMPLANITAILQLLPLTVTLGGVLLFREKIGWRRVTAIAVGFFGMLLIVRPGTDGFTIHTIYALISVICVTIRDLATRRISSNMPSLMVTLIGAVGVWVFSWFMMINTTWVPMDQTRWTYLAGAVTFVSLGYIFSVLVMRRGDVSFIAFFRYSGLLWSLILGFLVFGDWPILLTFIGAGLIVLSGLYTMIREAQIRRQTKAI